MGEERFVIGDGGVLHVQQVNDSPWDARNTWTLRPEDAFKEINAVARWVLLHPHLAKIGVGETRRWDAFEAKRDSERAFSAKDGRVTYDGNGMPVELVQELQQGTVRFRRRE